MTVSFLEKSCHRQSKRHAEPAGGSEIGGNPM